MNRNSRKFLKSWLRNKLRLYAVRATKLIAHYYGTRIGFVYVGGYPKSGTTWLSQMISHYMDIPYVDPYFFPLTFPGVVHNHWIYHPNLDHSIYIMRDGRDAMVSVYMNLMKNYLQRREQVATLSDRSPVKMIIRHVGNRANRDRYIEYLFGKHFDPWDVKRNLPLFIETELRKPFLPAVKQTWQDHVRAWHEKAKLTTFVKYEDLLDDCEEILSRTISHYLGEEVDREEIAYTVNRYSFRQQTGRNPGEEERTDFARKGISGDWKNYFSPESCQIFDHYAGDVLIEVGYEKDRDWVHTMNGA